MTSDPRASDPLASQPTPVCPRHPDRVSYVRCQRCERPVCPQCQRQAPVGVQCVDCVKAATASRPAVRTVFGGRVAGERPIVTLTIIGVTVAVFALQWVLGDSFTQRFEFWPPEAKAEPWRFLTAGFLHSTALLPHILFNMVALWLVGPELERLFGRVRYALAYLICAIGGSVGYFLLVPADAKGGWYAPTVGASGAVFGLFGALLVANRRLRRDNVPLIGLLVLNALLGLRWTNIAWQAHLGGFVTGLACAVVLSATARRGPVVQYAGLAAIFVVLVIATVIKAAYVPAVLLA